MMLTMNHTVAYSRLLRLFYTVPVVVSSQPNSSRIMIIMMMMDKPPPPQPKQPRATRDPPFFKALTSQGIESCSLV